MHAADIPALAERGLVSQQIGSGNETRADAPHYLPSNLSGLADPTISMVPDDQEVSAMPNKHSLNLRVKTRDRAAIYII